jgi:outer membrane receptor protein involved in Fe transport
MRILWQFAALLVAPAALAQVESLDPVTVSATRAPERASEVPFTVEVIPGDGFSDGAALTVDDALRSSADFSLFRRNDSMTANPTSQGVSLRGLGPSGASRSLVLLDGVPLNDPFGGWVPWSLLPIDGIDRVEIVPGGGATAWGNEALAGVIQIFTLAPSAGTGDIAVRLGDFDTRSAAFTEAVGLGPGVLELRGQDFATDGTVLVAPASRGPIDIDAASRHDSASARWRGSLGRDVTAVVTFRSFDEWRDNGTPYQQNRTRSLFGSATLAGQIGASESWTATTYLQNQTASQTFSSVNAARTAETPASDQFAVPATSVGFAGSTTWIDSTSAVTTVGADLRDIRGETREDFSYANGAYAEQRFAGGRQTFAGAFAERNQPLGNAVHLTLGVRLDRRENSDGHLRNTSASTGALLLENTYPTRTGTEFSPSAGMTWKAATDLEFHLAAQRAFREPTLNELYRPFRVGSTVTLANPDLSTEHADTAEIGATWTKGKLRIAAEGFAARLQDPVDNVTLVLGPGTFPGFGTLPVGGVGQERLNLDRIDAAGGELNISWAQTDQWRVDLSVIGENATVAAAAVAPNLVGNRIPEVPHWNAALGVTWHPVNRLYLTLRVRRTGSVFDDDQNRLPLDPATVVDGSLRVQLEKHAEVFLSVDNAANALIQVAHSAAGVYNVAPPRLVSAGARLAW